VFIVRHRIAASRSLLFRRILVPLDGSPLGEAILPHVGELARRYQATVLLLRVIEHPFSGVNPAAARLRMIAEAEEHLTEVKQSLAPSGLAVECTVRHGRAPEEISDHARQRAADLIVMSTHGRSGLRRAALGSVAESVLRGSCVPVFLLPSTALAREGAEDGRGRAAPRVG
jgi:nucleotide-binding universal stress UspA family protein